MKKKTYQQPEVQVIEFEQTEIICASTQADFQSYEEDDSTFSGNWMDF